MLKTNGRLWKPKMAFIYHPWWENSPYIGWCFMNNIFRNMVHAAGHSRRSVSGNQFMVCEASQNGQISSRHLESYWSPQIIPLKFIVEHENTSITGAWWTSSTDAPIKSTCARLQHRQHIAQFAHEPKPLHENKQWTIHKQCIPRTWSVKSNRKKCLHFVGISFTTSTYSRQTAIIRHIFFLLRQILNRTKMW